MEILRERSLYQKFWTFLKMGIKFPGIKALKLSQGKN